MPKALALIAVAALGAGCAMFDRPDDGPARTAEAKPAQTTPSHMEPVMTQTRPVDGGASTVVDPSTLAPTTTGTNTIIAAPAQQAAPSTPTSVPLAQLRDPEQVLAGATVKDRVGQSIGEVRAVRMTPDGRIAAVTVDTGARTVALQPARLKYVQAENTVVSDQSKAEIQRQR
jgi:hypothetical protein